MEQLFIYNLIHLLDSFLLFLRLHLLVLTDFWLYKTINQKLYIRGHFATVFIFIFYIIFLIIKSAINFGDWPVNGGRSDYFRILTNDNILSSFIYILFVPAIVLYGLVGLILIFKKGNLFLIGSLFALQNHNGS
uniref:Uncharacterized protein n=1 Tax=Meloidogyne enterolobii TaxID=390850 RepID=A0A6V7VZ84_MELEN|nr:unnamed protein product [Meloidogyne enterolobii]